MKTPPGVPSLRPVKAYQLTAWQSPPEMREVDVPEPGPGQVLIKVAGSGACHSDLHLMDWPEGTMDFDLPFTLGHENAGWVEALGAGVEGLETGEPVAVYGPWGCGRCRACRRSAENYCERQAEIGAFGGGLGLDGGMTEYMLVPHPRLLLPLGELDPREAAPLSDAALTPYHAIKRSLPLLTPGSTAVVIGVAGLDRVLGAAAEILELAGDSRVELIVDNVGADETIALGAAVAGFESHVTVVGLAGGKFEFAFGAEPFEAQLTIPYWGTAIELIEVLDLARAGKIRAHVERFPLDRAADAYTRLREGTLDGRAVICPHG